MTKPVKQTSFAGGRLSDELYGRSDLAKYHSAFKDSKNFFVSPEGNLLNRAGTEVIAEITSPANVLLGTEEVGLVVPFIFSDDDVLLLVFGGLPHDPTSGHEDEACDENFAEDELNEGRGFIRFFSYDRDTDTVTQLEVTVEHYTWTNWPTVPEVFGWGGNKKGFPWCIDDAKDFRFLQTGDKLFVTFKDAYNGYFDEATDTYKKPRLPFVLSRQNSAGTLWRYELLSFGANPFPSYGGVPRIAYQNFNEPYATTYVDPGLPEPDAEHPARVWQYAVSRIMQNQETGVVYETVAKVITETIEYRAEEYDPTQRYGGGAPPFSTVWVPPLSFYDEFYSPAYYAFLYHWYSRTTSSDWNDIIPYDGGDGWTQVDGWDFDPVVATRPVPRKLVCYVDKPQVIDFRVFTQRPEDVDPNADIILGARIYKGRDGYFGFIGEVDETGQEFIDNGITPDFATPPRAEKSHFIIPGRGDQYDTYYVPDFPEWPSVLGVYEGRFIYASTLLRPGLLVGSAVGIYDNVDANPAAKDDDAFSFELAVQQWEKIRFLHDQNGLYIFTSEAIHVAGGSGLSEILTPNSIARRKVNNFGSAKTRPVVIGETIVFVENTGSHPKALFMRGQNSETIDIAGVSRVFFKKRKIVSWAWAEIPYLTLWVVMDDGKLLSCAYSPEQQLIAWAEHEIQDANVLSVAVIPVDGEHGVFFLTQRGSKYYLERMASRVLTDIKDAKFLDAFVSYDGRNTTAANTAQIDNNGGNLIPGSDATLTLDFETTQGENLGKVIRLFTQDSDGETVVCEAKLHTDLALNSYTVSLITPLTSDFDGVQIALDTDEDGNVLTNWEWCVYNVSGLSHLDGETVKALVDGEVIDDLVVDGDTVVLGPAPGRYGARICVGLGYNCDFKSLAMAEEKGAQRVVKGVLVETYGSRGGYVGQSFDEDDLEEVLTREVQHDYGPIPLKNEEIPTNIKASYDTKGEIVFRQSAPLPISITAVVREVEMGGK